MKILLTSNGFVSEAIIACCENLVGKKRDKISIAVINEAYAVEHEDHRWLVDDMKRAADNFGGRLEIVNLLATPSVVAKERLSKADVIMVTGGHTDYLKTVFDKTGFSDYLPDLLSNSVYVGISAGSMIMCKRLNQAAYQKMYGDENDYGVTDYLCSVDCHIMPHLNSTDFPKRKEALLEATAHTAGIVYGLTDSAALVVNENKVSTIGEVALVIKDGVAQ